MDSIAQLALISKAKKVFANENTFLSFPVTPLAYEKEDLEFFSQESASDLLNSKENLNAFSTLVNLTPRGEAWLPTDPRFLWDDYEYVLRQGITAESTRTASEEAAYRDARDYLKDPGEGGIWKDSAPVRVYKQYRDAFLITEQEYMQARVAGEATPDEAEQQQWHEVDEPTFLVKLEDMKDDWILEGFKNEVDIAREKFIRLGAKSPLLRWAEWLALFNPDISSETSTDQSRVFLSSFMPSNALEEGSWRPFSLNESEVKSLIREASADLRRRYSADGQVSSIKSMTLEFSSAVIKRPWFDPQVFKSRFWKLGDESKVISNGSIPLDGDCPAYVTAVVFARNVVVQQKAPGQSPAGHAAVSPLHFNHAIRHQSMINTVSPKLLKAIRPARMQSLNVTARKTTPLRHASPRPRMVRMNVSRPVPRRLVIDPRARIRSKKILGARRKKPLVSTRPPSSSAVLNLRASAFKRPTVSPVIRPAATPSEPVQDDNIYILAFICKPFPKCPDPDPALVW